MIKHFTVAAAAIVAMGIAGAASAGTADVPVNIKVLPVTSIWSNDANITLALSGANAENSVGVAGSLGLINNIPGTVSADVSGTLPTPIVPGGGVNFFLFPNTNDVAGSLAAMVDNAYNPAGSLAWDIDDLGTSQQVADAPTIGLNTSARTFDIVYAADAPGELPLVSTWGLTVTYTFAP